MVVAFPSRQTRARGTSGDETEKAPPRLAFELFFIDTEFLRPSGNYQLTTHFTMRPLTEPETKTLFEKLATYCGKGIANLIDDPTSKDDRMVFRVQVSARGIYMAREQEH